MSLRQALAPAFRRYPANRCLDYPIRTRPRISAKTVRSGILGGEPPGSRYE